MTSIMTNPSAMTALASLQATNRALEATQNRISTGYRVAEASDNLPLLALFDQLNGIRRAVAWGSVERTSERPPPDHPSFAEHEAIADGIAARSPDGAFEAMRRHLRSVAARLFPD